MLATSWSVSQDGRTYTLKLRQGVQFHDGTPFNAQAVVYNFNRMRDPKFPSARKSEIAPVSEVVASDPSTVQIKLERPYSPLMYVLTDRAGMMVSPAAAEKDGLNFALRPVGSGPFSFVEKIPQDHITLKRNPNYWMKGLPYLDQVIFRPFPDDNARVANLTSGDVDIINIVPAQRARRLFVAGHLAQRHQTAVRQQGAAPGVQRELGPQRDRERGAAGRGLSLVLVLPERHARIRPDVEDTAPQHRPGQGTPAGGRARRRFRVHAVGGSGAAGTGDRAGRPIDGRGRGDPGEDPDHRVWPAPRRDGQAAAPGGPAGVERPAGPRLRHLSVRHAVRDRIVQRRGLHQPPGADAARRRSRVAVHGPAAPRLQPGDPHPRGRHAVRVAVLPEGIQADVRQGPRIRACPGRHDALSRGLALVTAGRPDGFPSGRVVAR